MVDNPPPYDYVTQGQDGKAKAGDAAKGPPALAAPAPAPAPALYPGPTYAAPPAHHYVNPQTGAHVASVLPPDHPEMLCLQAGGHVPRTRFGLLGVLAAIVWFPLGIGLCLLDRRVRCERCGLVLTDGVMCG